MRRRGQAQYSSMSSCMGLGPTWQRPNGRSCAGQRLAVSPGCNAAQRCTPCCGIRCCLHHHPLVDALNVVGVYRISSLVFIKPPPRNQAAASVLPQTQTAHAPELLPPQGELTWPSLKCIGQQGEQNRHPSCFIVVPTDSPATCCYPLACGGCRAAPKLSQCSVSHPPTHLPSNLTMLTTEDEEQAHH
jgi:hypothetical protein